MSTRSGLARRRRCTVVGAALLTVAVTATTWGIAGAAPGHRGHLPPPPRTPKESAAIEGFAPDQSQFFCRSSVEPGVKAFEKLVLARYPVSHSDGDMRGCNVGGTSEHKDGRAWDWGVDHRIAKQRAAGKSMLKWLFATDSYGNQDAMFRRLGLMYVIWNKQIWGAWSRQWEPYACSGPTLCHVNHMHFSFGWAGAEKKTSFWTHQVSPVLEPPLPVLSTLLGHRSLKVSAATGTAAARWLLKSGATYRVTASGVWHRGRGKSALADAVCSKTAHGWQPTSGGGISVGGDQLSLWNQQWTPVDNTGNGCNTATHTYRLTMTPLLPTTVTVQLAGSGRSGDSGTIKLRFERTA